MEDIIYFAGFFDGEGSVFINSNGIDGNGNQRYVLRCTLSQNNRDVLLDMQSIWGGSVTNKAHRGPLSKKDGYTWSCSVKKAKSFLTDVLPYLRVKKEEAVLALSWDGQDGASMQQRIRDLRG